MANYLAVTANDLLRGTTGIARTAKQVGPRGFSVYSLSQLQGITGTTRDGSRMTAQYERPLFSLSVSERIDMVRFTAPLFGLVTSRMHRVSGLQWNVVSDKKDEDRIADRLRTLKGIYDDLEGAGGPPAKRRVYRAAQLRIAREIREHLPTVLPDLSNFQRALMRWKREVRNMEEDMGSRIEDWLGSPNREDSFDDMLKKWIFDLMIHGKFGAYKEASHTHGFPALDNWYALPGGSLFPVKGPRVNSSTMYVQMVMGAEPQIYGKDELMVDTYVPTSFQEYGMVPLEALVNKVAESLLFDELSASQADGTKLPEKLIILGEESPFGDINADLSVPVNDKEQQKVETIINTARKGAITTITGVGNSLTEVDLTRSDTFPYYSQRQRQLREDMALVFNMSNMEVNLTGSGETSGRATSESEMQIDKERGLYPIMKQIEERINREIIPYAGFPKGYRFQFRSGASEEEELRTLMLKAKSGLWSVNELRQEELGRDPFEGEQYDVPPGTAQQEQPGASEANPLIAQLMGGGLG